MADSFVQATEGSGTKFDSRTVDTDQHRFVMVVGDPTTAAAVATVTAAEGLMVHFGPTDNAVLDAIQAAVAAIQTAVQIMDDWDETNRAAVNLIASQVGVAGGTGVDAANVLRVSLATNVPLPAGTAAIGKLAANSGVDIGDVDVTSIADQYDEYETVAASQTGQVLGPTGATGDYIVGILVIPATTSPGNVILIDNATSITVFAGGADSVLTLHPFFIPLGMSSASGAWSMTTGANVSCIAIGRFT
jgi:hypothetical protein